MDINNTPFFLLRTPAEFEQGSSRLSWNAARQALTLAQNQALRLPASAPDAALAAWAASTPLALDGFNQIGRLDGSATTVEFNSGSGFFTLQDSELNPVTAPAGYLQDLSLGGDGRLAVPYSDGASQHGLLLFHLAKRWLTLCALPLAPRRVWVDAGNRVWCIAAQALLLVEGEPLPLPYRPLADRFEPVTLNPHALRMSWQQVLPGGWEALALCGDQEQVYVLAHDGGGKQAILVRRLSSQDNAPFTVYPLAPFTFYPLAAAVPFAIDLALAGPGRLAALVPAQAGDSAFVQRDCPVLELVWDSAHQTGTAQLIHERYPMLSQAQPRFVTSADGQLRYQATADPDFPAIAPRPRELHPLRRPQYYTQGTAVLYHVFDAGQPDAHWHRLYLDACIPPGCGVQISVRVFDAAERRRSAPWILQPAPLWSPLPSELPYTPALAGQKAGEAGLFEILLQRPAGPVRRVCGRYLQIQVTFTGNGRHTPALYALRLYYPRFSYQEAYLPAFYRQELRYDLETSDSDPAYNSGPANGADVRERFLAALEGVLTPLEGRIAASDQLIHPDTAPAGHLPWLAEAVGLALPPHWPTQRQRRLLRDATLIQQWKGTLAGVNLALDILSEGGVQRGEIVVVENFRLRRTMATILGVNMDDQNHPLTLGTGMSGNSLIGDSLILSENDARSFLALFAPDLATTQEAAVVKAFFDQYAHQLTVLLHGRGARLQAEVEALLVEQLPAHLQWRIFETEHPFVLGIAPLLTVDTFIETTPDFRRVALNDTYLGREGVLNNPAAFSPQDINTLPTS